MPELPSTPPRRIAVLVVAVTGVAFALLPSPARADAPSMSDACALHCAGLARPAVQNENTELSHCGATADTGPSVTIPEEPLSPQGDPAMSCHALALQIEAACANHCQLDGMPAHPAGAAPEGLTSPPSPAPRADRTRSAAMSPQTGLSVRAAPAFDLVQSGFFRVPVPPPRS